MTVLGRSLYFSVASCPITSHPLDAVYPPFVLLHSLQLWRITSGSKIRNSNINKRYNRIVVPTMTWVTMPDALQPLLLRVASFQRLGSHKILQAPRWESPGGTGRRGYWGPSMTHTFGTSAEGYLIAFFIMGFE